MPAMNKKSLIALGIAVALVAGTVVFAQSSKPASGQGADPRIDKLIEQNEQILKNQEAILKKLDELQTGIGVLKRRSS
jgi:hypothetical protein